MNIEVQGYDSTARISLLAKADKINYTIHSINMGHQYFFVSGGWEGTGTRVGVAGGS